MYTRFIRHVRTLNTFDIILTQSVKCSTCGEVIILERQMGLITKNTKEIIKQKDAHITLG